MSRQKLIHFSKDHVTAVRSEKQGQRTGGAYKPNGFWVSVEGGKSFGWRSWCEAEGGYGGIAEAKQTEIVLHDDARILRLRTASQLDDFTAKYFCPENKPSYLRYAREPDWKRVAEEYQGIIIAPYQWSRRLHDGTNWYYSWDCASGCLWDAGAISRLIPRATLTAEKAGGERD